MLYKINKKLFIWLLFFVLLPLENVRATTVICPDVDYPSDYTYLYITIILIVVMYVLLMLLLPRVFVAKNKVLLFLRAGITFAALFIVLFIGSYFNRGVEGLRDFNTLIECKKSGGVLREGVCKTYCDFVNSDSGKSCNDNNDCEGYCEIENYYSRRSEIRDAWNNNFPDSDEVKISDWNDKTKIEMKGECNKFKSENKIPRCVDFFYEIIGVEGGFVKRINCINYYEWEFR